MSWHADPGLLGEYVAGRVDDAHALSIEAHLLGCQSCRLSLADLTGRPRLDAVWGRVSAAVEEPRRALVERALRRVGVSDHVARLLAATPSLSGAWIAAVALCLCFAVVAANVGSRGSIGFLALAPLLPVAGVAVAYGPWLDPLYEVSLAAPMSSFRLLLLRAGATLATTLLLSGVAALALPGPDWLAAAWLLPSLALTLASLALGSYVAQRVAAFAVGLTWIAAVALGPALADDRFAVFRAGGQAACLAVAVLAAAALARRHAAFDEEGRFDV